MGAGGKGGQDYFNKIIDVWDKIQDPNFDMTQLQALDLQIVAEMFPEVYQAKIPEEVKLANDSPELRQAQVAGVNKLQRVAEQGLPIEDKVAAQQAQQVMAGQAQRQQTNITENLAARGMMGGGAELQARLAGGQQGAQLAGTMGADLARQGALRSLQAAEALPGAAGQVRGQDINLSQQQADAINRFNEMRAQMTTAQNQYAAGAKERAQGYNVQTAQSTANQNQMLGYQNQLENLNRANALRQQQYSNQMAKAQGLSGAYGQMGNMLEQNKAAREQTIMNLGKSLGKTMGGAADLAGLF
jgi:hypothetical protein